MKTRGHSKGFTIVELIVVIIVIAILATMISLAYNNAQIQSRDTAIRDAAQKFSETIKVMEIRQGSFPKGGAGSTTAVSTASGCVDGAGGWESYNYYSIDTSYRCTLGDAAVAMGYLPATFFTTLPPNVGFGNTAAQDFMVQYCGTTYYLFYTLEMPTAAETSNYTALISSGGVCYSVANSITPYNMKAAINLSTF